MTGMSPWLTVGTGLYHISSKITDAGPANSTDSVNKWGLHGGVGLDWKAGETMKFGVHGVYHYVTDAFESTNASGGTDKKGASYVTAGINLTFMTSGVTK